VQIERVCLNMDSIYDKTNSGKQDTKNTARTIDSEKSTCARDCRGRIPVSLCRRSAGARSGVFERCRRGISSSSDHHWLRSYHDIDALCISPRDLYADAGCDGPRHRRVPQLFAWEGEEEEEEKEEEKEEGDVRGCDRMVCKEC